eukprot:1322054-Rhodomonas_salina.1
MFTEGSARQRTDQRCQRATTALALGMYLRDLFSPRSRCEAFRNSSGRIDLQSLQSTLEKWQLDITADDACALFRELQTGGHGEPPSSITDQSWLDSLPNVSDLVPLLQALTAVCVVLHCNDLTVQDAFNDAASGPHDWPTPQSADAAGAESCCFGPSLLSLSSLDSLVARWGIDLSKQQVEHLLWYMDVFGTGQISMCSWLRALCPVLNAIAAARKAAITTAVGDLRLDTITPGRSLVTQEELFAALRGKLLGSLMPSHARLLEFYLANRIAGQDSIESDTFQTAWEQTLQPFNSSADLESRAGAPICDKDGCGSATREMLSKGQHCQRCNRPIERAWKCPQHASEYCVCFSCAPRVRGSPLEVYVGPQIWFGVMELAMEGTREKTKGTLRVVSHPSDDEALLGGRAGFALGSIEGASSEGFEVSGRMAHNESWSLSFSTASREIACSGQLVGRTVQGTCVTVGGDGELMGSFRVHLVPGGSAAAACLREDGVYFGIAGNPLHQAGRRAFTHIDDKSNWWNPRNTVGLCDARVKVSAVTSAVEGSEKSEGQCTVTITALAEVTRGSSVLIGLPRKCCADSAALSVKWTAIGMQKEGRWAEGDGLLMEEALEFQVDEPVAKGTETSFTFSLSPEQTMPANLLAGVMPPQMPRRWESNVLQDANEAQHMVVHRIPMGREQAYFEVVLVDDVDETAVTERVSIGLVSAGVDTRTA